LENLIITGPQNNARIIAQSPYLLLDFQFLMA
jgi:hypothetical protein